VVSPSVKVNVVTYAESSDTDTQRMHFNLRQVVYYYKRAIGAKGTYVELQCRMFNRPQRDARMQEPKGSVEEDYKRS
jgi:succinylarginine dihydrolase